MYAFECIKKVRKTSFPYFFSTNCDSSLEPHHMVMFAWYRWWDSNPHGFPPDFESFKVIYTYLFLTLNIAF